MAHSQIIDLEPGEHVLHTLKRTKLGLIPLGASGVLVLGGMLIAIYLISRFRDTVAANMPLGIAIAVVLGITFLVGIILLISIVVYLGNHLVITNERIISIVQSGLFSRQVSHLNLGDVQEVTVKQRNIFESLFNFGTLHIETAGEMDNFTFKLAKAPYLAAKHVNEANEEFEKTHHPGSP